MYWRGIIRRPVSIILNICRSFNYFQYVGFTTTHCFINPWSKPSSGKKDVYGDVYRRVPVWYYVSSLRTYRVWSHLSNKWLVWNLFTAWCIVYFEKAKNTGKPTYRFSISLFTDLFFHGFRQWNTLRITFYFSFTNKNLFPFRAA
jgi:hypothetical protein